MDDDTAAAAVDSPKAEPRAKAPRGHLSTSSGQHRLSAQSPTASLQETLLDDLQTQLLQTTSQADTIAAAGFP